MAAEGAGGKGGKGKKNKGTKLDLESVMDPNAFKMVDSWADEMENEEVRVPMVNLPTAPKASTGADIDFDQIPHQPPFKAYVSNISFESNQANLEKFFSVFPNMKVTMGGESGRPSGNAFVEFESRTDLIEALHMSGKTLNNRQLKIQLSTTGDRGGGFGAGGRRFHDNTPSNWRSREGLPPKNMVAPPPTEPEFGGRGGGGRDFGSGFGRNNYGGGREGGFGGGRDREDGFRGGRSEGGGFGRRENRYGDDGGQWQRGPPRESAPSESGGESNNWRTEKRPPPPEPREQRPERRPPPPEPREPRPEGDRPEADLKEIFQAITQVEEENKPSSYSSIFGDAKPVDTISKELEIEEKLAEEAKRKEAEAEEKKAAAAAGAPEGSVAGSDKGNMSDNASVSSEQTRERQDRPQREDRPKFEQNRYRDGPRDFNRDGPRRDDPRRENGNRPYQPRRFDGNDRGGPRRYDNDNRNGDRPMYNRGRDDRGPRGPPRDGQDRGGFRKDGGGYQGNNRYGGTGGGRRDGPSDRYYQKPRDGDVMRRPANNDFLSGGNDDGEIFDKKSSNNNYVMNNKFSQLEDNE